MLFPRLVHRCQKTGRKGRILLLLSGIAATVWYLVRVVPKPSRAAYPCQRAAFPVMTGFLVYIAALAGSVMSFRTARRFLRNSKYFYAALFLIISVVSLFVFIGSDARDVYAAPNAPIGTAKGIFPGRVAWVHNPNAALWTGTGNYWAAAVNPQAEYDKAFTAGIKCLSGGTDDATSWDLIFRWFNNSHGRAGTGYLGGDMIAVKINQNNSPVSAADAGNTSNANPQSCVAVVRSLVNAGVPQAEIYIGDPSRAVSDNIFNAVHGVYPDVKVVDHFGNNGRVTTNTVAGAFPYGDGVPDSESGCFYNARYIINQPLMKGHIGQIVTFGAKNFYGATGISNIWQNNAGHPGMTALSGFMTSPNFGGKTVLWCMDAMYPNPNLDGTPDTGWTEAPFNGRPMASFIMSLDGPAEESVSIDFFGGHYGTGPAGEVYIIYAATAGAGVEEHWNNDTDRQYSRNLDPVSGTGIELVYIDASAAGVKYPDAKVARRHCAIAGCKGSRVTITLPAAGTFRLTIHTLAGKEAGEISGSAASAGTTAVSVKPLGLPPGTYLMKLSSNGAHAARQVRVGK